MDSTIDQQELMQRLEDPLWRMNNLYAIRTKMQGYEGETIIYEPNYVQRKIYQKIEEGWKRIIILKPRKLGVTTGVSLYLLDKAMFGRNQMCRTIAHRKQTVTELFNDIPRFAFEELKRRSPTFAPKEKYTTRSELEFVGTGSKYSIDVEARGMTPTFLHFSEIAYIEDEAKLIDSLESLSRNNVGIAESTANGKGNWFNRTFMNNYELLNRGEKPEWYPLFFPWFSDPDNWLPWYEGSKLFYPEECLEQKRKYRNPDGTELRKEQILWWDRKKFELGDLLPEKYPSEPEEAFLHQTGRVYPEFSTMHNVIKQVQFKDYKIAMDYGQKNPMVFACIHQDFDSNFTMFREFYKTNCPIRDAAQWLRQYCPDKVDEDGYVFIDFPDPSVFNDTQQNPYEYKHGQHRYSIADEFMRHKVILRPGVQNDILSGLVRVAEYLKFDPMHPNPYKRDQNGNPRLGSPRFFITENCKNTIGEFELYRWPKEKSGALDKNAYEKPVKEHDHCVSGDSMILLANGKYKAIKNMVGGCYLVKVNGKDYKCNHIRKTDENTPVYRVLLSNGSSIQCTPEHLIWNGEQWKSALDYRLGEWIQLDTYVCQNNQSYYSRIPWEEILLMWSILPKKWKSLAYRCLHPLPRKDPKWNACASQGSQQKEQSNRKLGNNQCFRSFATSCQHADCRTERLQKKKCSTKSNASSKEMASIRKRKEVAFWTRKGWMDKKGLAYETMFCLWQAIRNTISIPIKILSPKLQSESIKGKAQVVDISFVGHKDTYNMEVDHIERFALSGGAIVHNSMDAIRYALLSDAKPLEYDVQSDEAYVPEPVRSAVELVQQYRRDQDQSRHLQARAL